MSIRCGHCKGRHETVDAVKECRDMEAEALAEAAQEAYADHGYARYLESRAENGSWFGFGD